MFRFMWISGGDLDSARRACGTAVDGWRVLTHDKPHMHDQHSS